MNPENEQIKKWILLVEDDIEISSLLELLLIQNGYNVIKAIDGVEALNIYKTHVPKINLVISDLGLPSLGGIELFQKLLEFDKSVKFIASSGFDQKNFEAQLLSQGIKAFLPKPYHAETLLKVIENILKED